MNRGRHSFRTGGELRLGRDGATLHHWERPSYAFQNILDFVDDEAFTEDRAVDPATGLPTTAYGKYLTNEWALFFQDNWKVRSNVTLNLGLRYDNFGNPKKADIPYNGIILGAGANRQEQMRTARVGTVDQLYDTDWNNFAPRVGLTWDPTSEGRFVIRGGGGISYNRINNTVYSDERLNPPQFAHASGSVQDGTPIVYSLGPNFAPNGALGRGIDANGGIIGARVSLRVVDPELEIPEYYNWFTGVQYQLPWRFVAEVNYSGTKGRKLLNGDGPGGEDYNRFSGDLRDNGVRNRLNNSFADVGLNESRIKSTYHGLSLQLLRRYSSGFSFQTVYNYGSAKDYAGSAMIVEQPELDYGYASFDIRHQFKFNFIWEIPYHPDNAILDGSTRRMAVERAGDVPERVAVHRHLYAGVSGLRLQRRWRQQRSRQSACLRHRPRQPEPGRMDRRRHACVRLHVPGSGAGGRSAAQCLPRTRLQERGHFAREELPAARALDGPRLELPGAARDVQRVQLGQPEQPGQQREQRQLRPGDWLARQRRCGRPARRAARLQVDVLG